MKTRKSTPKDPEPARPENSPELQFKTPLGRLEALILSPNFFAEFQVKEAVISTVRYYDGSDRYKIHLDLGAEVTDLTIASQLFEHLKAFGFTGRVERPSSQGGAARIELTAAHTTPSGS